MFQLEHSAQIATDYFESRRRFVNSGVAGTFRVLIRSQRNAGIGAPQRWDGN
jgi:hypothetical protein